MQKLTVGSTSGVARVNGIDIHYQVTDYTDPWKKPATVLLHHGFARNQRFWYQWVPLLCRDYRVVTFDSRGMGDTTCPRDYEFNFEDMVADVIGLLDELGIDRVHWGSEASGGIVGVATALAHPGRVASITTCNTPFRIPKGFLGMFVNEEVRAHGMGYWAQKTLKGRVDVDKVPQGWIDWTTAEFARADVETTIAIHELMKKVDLWEQLPLLKTPLLILVGDGSTIATHADMQAMSQRIPGSRLKVFEGYGQGVAFMIPERCIDEMKRFIAALPAK